MSTGWWPDARHLRGEVARRGIGGDARAEAVAAAERAGLVDDARYARRRAETLAERGRGDAAIRWQLGHDGLAHELVEEVLGDLTPEADRAAQIVARRGRGPKTARYLASRGFGREAVERASGADEE